MTEFKVEVSSRQQDARKLYKELLNMGIVQSSEELATIALTASSNRAEQDTRERPKQKKLYKGKDFGFESALALAVYFITECPLDWDKWKKQYKIYESIDENIEGQQAKDDARPTLDRIDDSKGYIRGNLQTLSDKKNREKAYARMRKQRAVLVSNGATLEVGIFESHTAINKALNVSDSKMKNMGKRGYAVVDKAAKVDTGAVVITLPVTTLELTATEEEYKAQCEAHGITYETAEVRAERDKRMLEQAFNN